MAQVLPFKAVEDDSASLAEVRADRPFLGEVLVRSGALAREQVEAALTEQRGQDSLLGTILLVQGLISSEALTDALSEQSGFGQINLEAAPPDPALMDTVDPHR